MTSWKVAAGGTAAVLLLGGGATIESTGLGHEVRQSIGIGASHSADADAQLKTTAVEATIAGSARSELRGSVDAAGGVESLDGIEIDVGDGSAAVGLGLNGALGVGAASGAVKADISAGAAPRASGSADLHGAIGSPGDDRPSTPAQLTGAADASAGAMAGDDAAGSDAPKAPANAPESSPTLHSEAHGQGTSGADSPTHDGEGTRLAVAVDGSAIVAPGGSSATLSYSALLDLLRRDTETGDSCEGSEGDPIGEATGTVSATLVRQAALQACAEAAGYALPLAPAPAEGATGSASLLAGIGVALP